MWTVGNKRRQEEKEGRKEGRDGGAMGGGDGEPRPYTLAVHGCDILPYLVSCSPTLVEFTWKGNPSFLYLLTRVVRVLVTRREHRRATTSPRCLSCSPGIPTRANHPDIAWIGPRNFRSRFVRLSSYEKLLVGCMRRTEESRNGGVNSEGYRSNLFVRGNDGRLRLFASTRYLIATFRSTV